MEFNLWISKINQLDNRFFIDKHHLINCIQLIESKYLTIERYDKYLPQFRQNNDCIFIWDCEFQVFKINKQTKHNKIQYEIIAKEKMIRCISEIGLIILFNIKNIIYFVGFIHISFLNKQFQKVNNYLPFYHEYMSVNNKSTKKIIKIEKTIYPHIIFEKIWNKFKYNNNSKIFQSNIIIFLKNNILKKNKSIYKLFNNQLNNLIKLLEESIIVENNIIIDKLINKIITNLKNIIYNNTIEMLNKTNEFSKIKSIYLDDKYIKSILIKEEDHNIIINNLNNMFSTGLNISKVPKILKLYKIIIYY
jgi:hypothetical protein